MTTHRKERVGDVILAFLADQIRRLHDPRLGLVTLTGVEMAPDLKSARVYWTVPTQKAGDQQLAKDADFALRGSIGLLKRRIGEELKLRYTPQLFFRLDESIARGERIDHLLDSISNDKESEG